MCPNFTAFYSREYNWYKKRNKTTKKQMFVISTHPVSWLGADFLKIYDWPDLVTNYTHIDIVSVQRQMFSPILYTYTGDVNT